MKRGSWLAIAAAVIVVALGVVVALWFAVGRSPSPVVGAAFHRRPPAPAPSRTAMERRPYHPAPSPAPATPTPAPSPDPVEPDEAETLVENFDALTDRWMEPTKGEIPMDAVSTFVAAFKRLPKDRQDECVHRALNLIPDENAMLLAGLLMDKTVDRAIVETVFNDVLNRGEDVKEPILREIFKDKTHPCWADTAWILDVTGQQPQSNPQTPTKEQQ